MEIDDSALIVRILDGDLAAFPVLVERYRPFVFAIALNQLENEEDAKDVSQDVFVRAYSRIEQVRDRTRFGAWLRQITVNECRAWRTRCRDRAGVAGFEAASANQPDPDNRITLNRALARIDEPSRLTVILYYQHAYSHTEIGGLLEEPVTTIKSRLRNARAKLKRQLEEKLEERLKPDLFSKDFSERITQAIAAAQRGDATTIRDFLDRDPGLADARHYKGGHSALHVAASSGNAAVVELLLHFGANPNAKDEGDNATALHYASERGWLDCVRLLVEAGSDVNANDDLHERGPLGWACVFDAVRWEVVDYLLFHGARFDLFSAIACGREDEVRSLVADDPRRLAAKMSKFEGYQSPIEFAAGAGQPGIARTLAEMGAPVGLREAAALGDLEQLVKLTESPSAGGDIDEALRVAVRGRNYEAARLLLQSGANPDYAPRGLSLIFDALSRVDEPMARVLLEFGANLEFRDSQWNATALGWEVFYGRPEGVRLGLDLGAIPDPHLTETAQAGVRGEWRRYTSASAEDYRRVAIQLAASQPDS